MKIERLILLWIICWVPLAKAQTAMPATLDELLEQVRRAKQVEEGWNNQREQRFLNERDAQAQRLIEAREAYAAEQQHNARIESAFEANAERINALEIKLQERSGSLLELFGLVRQIAGDTRATLEDSLVSTQIPGRSKALEPLSGSDSFPSIEQLEVLWFALQEEMTESGKVVSYPTSVISVDGSERQRRVMRIGVFNAVSDGSYLRHLPDKGKLQELAEQPSGRYRDMAFALQTASSGMQPMAIDPSRGAVLALLTEKPDLWERVQQGRLVGYVIILIGAIGLLIALERGLHLVLMGRRIHKQIQTAEPDTKNPLGRVMAVYRDNRGLSLQTLEMKMDESILRDSSRLQRGLPTVKILAAIAPLLGLLGTVVGLIETFQSITLFGAGDPALMAGGISQALVTTVLGLIAAIPLILLHSMLSSHGRRLTAILEEQSAGIIAMQAEQGERDAAMA